MPVEMSVRLQGGDKVLKKLKKIKASLLNTRKLFDREVIVLQGIFTRRFESEGEGRWQSLSDATLQISGEHKPLQDTGSLKGSLGAKNSASMIKMSRTQLTFGTTHKAASVQNAGAKIGVTGSMRGFFAMRDIYLSADKQTITIPKRLFFYLTSADGKKLFATWKLWADQEVRRHTQ